MLFQAEFVKISNAKFRPEMLKIIKLMVVSRANFADGIGIFQYFFQKHKWREQMSTESLTLKNAAD